MIQACRQNHHQTISGLLWKIPPLEERARLACPGAPSQLRSSSGTACELRTDVSDSRRSTLRPPAGLGLRYLRAFLGRLLGPS
eukprot:1601240-Pyramimonas_sp.AAC.1